MIEAPTDVTLTNQALWTDDSVMEDDEIVGLSFRKATPKTFLAFTTNMDNNLLFMSFILQFLFIYRLIDYFHTFVK